MGINEYRDAGSSVPGNVVRDMLIGLQYAGNDVCIELFVSFDNMEDGNRHPIQGKKSEPDRNTS